MNGNMPESPVCCVVVTYDVDDLFHRVAEAIMPQVRHTVIVDNGSRDPTRNLLRRLQENDPSSVTVIWLPENRGIAAALNIGAREAIGKGFEWILTLDHDSVAGTGMVGRLLSAYGEVADHNPGILSPLHVDRETGDQFRYVAFGAVFFRRFTPRDNPAPCSFCITSGSLLHKRVFETAGFFREDYFLYAVDSEFCRRVLRKGYRIFVTPKAILYHREGKRKAVPIPFLRWNAPDWGPKSLYYIFRNVVFDQRDSRPFSSRIYDALFLLKTFLTAVLLVGKGERKERLSAARRGVVDGVRGRLGKSEDY